ncbi:MAG: hypothetical protein L0J17_13395 [Brevibacterium sp.]|uniref:hypothetical protein n=1 Tax=Brevibacterium sp. TaxID=1701 RepID=UPI00264990D6|nr:hypothetical protein [Brevibacterium sp.]MDN5805949.1 hypothetical protein [Brevibacterium sp.]MDN5910540.1 hypothetical protein [Brevibacterium sp.]MDN6134686.1 hypothetical protein [Brevibacterium sp.]MDN6158781.1 hypothetical protein [Brevibacterium sp.]MDN6176374.1 hypothetical protein [Brevibacterium sp.]
MLVDTPNIFDDRQGKELDAGMCHPDASNDEIAVHRTFVGDDVTTPLLTIPGADPYDRRRTVS